MLEAVDYVHGLGWDQRPTLFALVPAELITDAGLDTEDSAPLALVVQDELPEGVEAGTPELGDYISRTSWPDAVEGIILAQEIQFKDTSAEDAHPRPARLFSGVLRDDGLETTLLQVRPTEEELAAAGPFAQDEVQLRGGPTVAPAVIDALRYSLERSVD